MSPVARCCIWRGARRPAALLPAVLPVEVAAHLGCARWRQCIAQLRMALKSTNFGPSAPKLVAQSRCAARWVAAGRMQ
eukprot:4947834-Pyramimonas_sp.AAC.1